MNDDDDRQDTEPDDAPRYILLGRAMDDDPFPHEQFVIDVLAGLEIDRLRQVLEEALGRRLLSLEIDELQRDDPSA